MDLKCGFIQIILSEDDCFAGAINSKDAGFGKILEKNCSMNLGRFMLTILLYKVSPLKSNVLTGFGWVRG